MTHTGPTAHPGDYLIFRLQVAMARATSEVMNTLAPDCTPLSWRVPSEGELEENGMRGVVPGWMESREEIEFALEGWAEQFELQPATRVMPGTLRYEGTIHGLPVSVWGVIDPDAYKARMRELISDV